MVTEDATPWPLEWARQQIADMLDAMHGDFGIVTSPATLRTHNGETFPPVFDQPLAEGVSFDVVERRGDWLHVCLLDGTDGWLPSQTADVIIPAATPWG